ncbi:pyridoxamine 5'-phosphate oxidase family protein [Streptomyces sp. VRA16 Mangrove soil]|uniref:pyridoxamine 5'-phosphate oxidase family protein n=1 Tax=Streptomyces sp. VRA16 Mangrove soil TaxID=2817434 RepID=UPI001A9F4E77|nr:pyridoxamine 5'-phosphate oxidase family protein [Streptomyces sp. VRA16 Mangrove soil]MBO1332900.1 pyridoxamine 5'-phosphate oxidase family protein [Streptomyces sp. VRA16 Mangrove soil]
MTEAAPARSAKQRKQDTLARLEQDVDVWVATADPESGAPYMMPLSFLWHDGALIVSTRESNPVARNLVATGKAHLAIGQTRDVVHIEGAAELIADGDLTPELGDAFAERTGFDPRGIKGPYVYFRIRPLRVQAWREANELAGRDLMRDGTWLLAD